MKTKEELEVLKEEVVALNEKLAELSEDELNQVTGGNVSQSGWGTDGEIGWATCNNPDCKCYGQVVQAYAGNFNGYRIYHCHICGSTDVIGPDF